MAIRNSWVLSPLLCQKSCSTYTNCLGSVKPLCSIRLRDSCTSQEPCCSSISEEMAISLSCGTPRRDRVILSPGESQLSPCKGEIWRSSYSLFFPWSLLLHNHQELPPSHLSFSHSVEGGNGPAMAQVQPDVWAQLVWGVPASVPLAQQSWALTPVGDAAAPWVSCLQCSTSKTPKSSDTFAMTQLTCCLSITFAVPKDILGWCHPVCPLVLSNTSSTTEALSDVFGLETQPSISQYLGFLRWDECRGIFMVTSGYRERKDCLPAQGTKKCCPHWGRNLKSHLPISLKGGGWCWCRQRSVPCCQREEGMGDPPSFPLSTTPTLSHWFLGSKFHFASNTSHLYTPHSSWPVTVLPKALWTKFCFQTCPQALLVLLVHIF